ncbi:MAG: hypothetical protein WHV67_02790 [Thermoanaerobaculia bacterium]
MNFITEFSTLIKIGCPIIGIITTEEQRFANLLKKIFSEKDHFLWTSHLGLVGKEENIYPIEANEAIKKFSTRDEKVYIWLKITENLMEEKNFIRALKDEYYHLKGRNRFIILSSSNFAIPEELIGEIQILRLPPPDENEIQNIIESFFRSANLSFSPMTTAHAVAILKGLKQSEIEFSLKKALLSLKEKGLKGNGSWNQSQ